MALEYTPGNSILHRLDPRTKIASFFAITYISLVYSDLVLLISFFVMLYLLAIHCVPAKKVNTNLLNILPAIITFFFLNLWFGRVKGETLLFYALPMWNALPVTVEALIYATVIFFRFITVVLAIQIVLYVTPITDLILGFTKQATTKNGNFLKSTGKYLLAALAVTAMAHAYMSDIANITVIYIASYTPQIHVLSLQIPFAGIYIPSTLVLEFIIGFMIAFIALKILERGVPPEVGLTISMGFASVVLLSKQFNTIVDAMKSRAHKMEYRNPVKKVKAIAPAMIPIFWTTILRSQDISAAIVARGFTYNIRRRTYRRQIVFQKIDWAVSILVVFFIILGAYFNSVAIEQTLTTTLAKLIFSLLKLY